MTFNLQVTEFIDKNPFALAQYATPGSKFLHQFAQGLSAYVK